MSPPARIYIATPTPNGFVAAEHATSVGAMLSDLHAQGAVTTYRSVDGPDLAIQRDMLAGDFLASDFSHLLLVDAEISFEAALCGRLLGFGKPVIGAAYATGALDLARLERQLKERPLEAARALSYDWNIAFLDGSITVQNGIGRVGALGPGFLLIERSALAAVAGAPETPRYRSPDGRTLLPALFRELANGSAVASHDHVFCRRWSALGGETWVYVHAGVRRIAGMRFGMPYRRFLEAKLATAEPPTRELNGALAPERGS